MYVMNERGLLNGRNKAMFLNNTRDLIDAEYCGIFHSKLISVVDIDGGGINE